MSNHPARLFAKLMRNKPVLVVTAHWMKFNAGQLLPRKINTISLLQLPPEKIALMSLMRKRSLFIDHQAYVIAAKRNGAL